MARRTRRTAGSAEESRSPGTIRPGAQFGDVTFDAGDPLLRSGVSIQLIKLAQDADGLIFQRHLLSSVFLVGQLADGVIEFELFDR